MNKTNIFKSSEFYMGVNDILHMIILEEEDIFPDIELVNRDTEEPEDGTLSAPLANVATDQTASSFVANWEEVNFAEGYYLDVATDSNFVNIVAGFDSLDVGDVLSYLVDGLPEDTYYYRLRAYRADEESSNSNVIEVADVSWDLGYLYTYPVVNDTREIAAAGWHVPTEDDFNDLQMELDPWSFGGFALMDSDPMFWASGLGTNELKFNARGAGYATDTEFSQIGTMLRIWLRNTGIVKSIDIEDNGVIDDGATTTNAISMRLVKDSTILSHGDVSVDAYTGNDGKTYDSVCIGGKEWLSRNLAETKFRNSFKVIYGALYNWYVSADVRNICPEGWHIPTISEYTTFYDYVGGSSLPISDTSTEYWNNPFNHLITNAYRFNARGSGSRSRTDGTFQSLKNTFSCWLSTEVSSLTARHMVINIALADGYKLLPDPYYFLSYNYKRAGEALRPIKNTTILSHGQQGTYQGNDGKVYRTICIGTQEWLADNLCETKFRNGDTIPLVEDNAAWAALTDAGMCYYDNDIDNAFLDTDEIPLALLASSPDFDDPIRLAYDDNEDYV